MSIGPVDDWSTGLSDIGSVAPIAGAEGLWAGVVFIFGIWFVIACFRIGQLQAAETNDELSDPEVLRKLLAFLEGQTA